MTKPLKPLSKVTLKVANAAFREIMPLVYARRFDEALDVLRENRIGPTTTYDGAKRRFWPISLKFPLSSIVKKKTSSIL